jgi:hypothetical protein
MRDEQGKVYSVRYEAVNAMLLNEFLREHQRFQQEKRKVEKLEGALAAVNERLKEQDAKINRVAVVELTEPTRQAALH